MYIYGDILVNGNTQHDKVAILEKNKSVDLKFVLDMSKMNLIDAPSVWKGEKRKAYVEKWIQEVIQQ